MQTHITLEPKLDRLQVQRGNFKLHISAIALNLSRPDLQNSIKIKGMLNHRVSELIRYIFLLCDPREILDSLIVLQYS